MHDTIFNDLFRAPRKSSELRQQANERSCVVHNPIDCVLVLAYILLNKPNDINEGVKVMSPSRKGKSTKRKNKSSL